jgi:hypothetical protein
MRIVVAIVTTIAAALFLLSLCVFILVIKANAHDALPTPAKPLGWSYPFACCANYDCRTAETGEIKESSDGYHTPSGEVIPMSDKRIKDSPDGEFHWCAHQTGLDAGRTICLFVPPRSY